MTSGTFRRIDPAAVIVQREARQRRELRGIPELADSIREIGLINPIVLTDDGVLVAGERRLAAVRSLGWASIPYQLASDLDPVELHQIELEENVKREALTWQEHAKAVEDYHNLRRAKDPSWTQSKTAEALGYQQNTVSNQLEVARAMKSSPKIATAPKFSVALGLASRATERRASAILAPVKSKPAKQYPGEIIHADFFEYDYDGPPINFLHCDFPYGVGMHNSDQGGGDAHGTYEDTPELYFQLLDRLASFTADSVAPSAHLMFWFSMAYYRETYDALTTAGWKIDSFPLVWHKSDNTGILPDRSRGPRRTYETAFYGSRGDRKIVQPVANSFSGPTSRVIHMSEKPLPMLQHFFRMFVDESSVVFDPTAGSGASIRAAEGAGAAVALGLEINPEFAQLAQEALEKTRGH